MYETKLQECTAQEIFAQLKSKNLLTQQGYIEVFFAGIRVRVKDKSSVGNLFQEWFGLWLKEQKIFFRQKINTQEFPDFLLHQTSDQEGLLEIKVFDASAGPNFDIANFDAYVRSLRTYAYRLNADYLIFGYTLDNGVLMLKDFWLKKIWQISGTSSTRPIRVQEKQDKIFNLRPIIWFSEASKVTPPFESQQAFLTAIRETLAQTKGPAYAEDWFREVSQSYEAYFQTNVDLS
jgi:NgoBV restriction endonuclease